MDEPWTCSECGLALATLGGHVARHEPGRVTATCDACLASGNVDKRVAAMRITAAASLPCQNCERCTWNQGPDCEKAEHPHCTRCGHCFGRHSRDVCGDVLAKMDAEPYCWHCGGEHDSYGCEADF